MLTEVDYPGDDAWRAFVEAVRHEFDTCDRQHDVLSAVEGDEELAVAVWYALGDDFESWLARPIPVLDGGLPRDFLVTPQGRIVMRALLMRMP